METKKLIIIGAIFFLVFLIVYLFFFVFFFPRGDSIIPTVTPRPTFIISPFLPTQILPTLISDDKIIISNIEVNNFYKTAREIFPNGDVIILDNNEYQIVYYSQSLYFQISINQSPFATFREKAETEFLNILGIAKQDACQLEVKVTTPQFANPDYAGETYSLSFCQ